MRQVLKRKKLLFKKWERGKTNLQNQKGKAERAERAWEH